MTAGGMKLDFPGLAQLKSVVINEQDAWGKITRDLDSHHVVAVVRTVRTGDQKTLSGYTITDTSSRAPGFYAVSSQQAIIGWNEHEEMRHLRPYMNDADYQAFEEDQIRVADALSNDGEAYARVPIVFNDKHPHYPKQRFLPIIVSLGEQYENYNGGIEQDITVMYLNVEKAIQFLNFGLRPDRVSAAPSTPPGEPS
jgi:hypothetical protein